MHEARKVIMVVESREKMALHLSCWSGNNTERGQAELPLLLRFHLPITSSSCDPIKNIPTG